MNLTPQQQVLNTQATNLQHQLQNSMHGNNPMASVLHREVTALKNDIAANRNSVTLNDRMKKINTMLQSDARMQGHPAVQPGHYQQGSYQMGQYQNGHYQPGHYEPGHLQTGAGMPNQTVHPAGPSFSHNESNNMRYGLRQMSATLNKYAKF